MGEPSAGAVAAAKALDNEYEYAESCTVECAAEIIDRLAVQPAIATATREREEARDVVSELREERDTSRQYADIAIRERDAALARVAETRQALVDYGQHEPRCAIELGPDRKCDCGLEYQLRAALGGGEGG